MLLFLFSQLHLIDVPFPSKEHHLHYYYHYWYRHYCHRHYNGNDKRSYYQDGLENVEVSWLSDPYLVEIQSIYSQVVHSDWWKGVFGVPMYVYIVCINNHIFVYLLFTIKVGRHRLPNGEIFGRGSRCSMFFMNHSELIISQVHRIRIQIFKRTNPNKHT